MIVSVEYGKWINLDRVVIIETFERYDKHNFGVKFYFDDDTREILDRNFDSQEQANIFVKGLVERGTLW